MITMKELDIDAIRTLALDYLSNLGITGSVQILDEERSFWMIRHRILGGWQVVSDVGLTDAVSKICAEEIPAPSEEYKMIAYLEFTDSTTMKELETCDDALMLHFEGKPLAWMNIFPRWELPCKARISVLFFSPEREDHSRDFLEKLETPKIWANVPPDIFPNLTENS